MSDEADRMIRWLAMNRFNTPDNQPSAEVQDVLEQLPWNRDMLTTMIMSNNPLLPPSPANGYTLSAHFTFRPGWWPPRRC